MTMEMDFRLKNGLRVFVQESHAAPVVAVQMWINAGSCDERPEEAGVAHLLEHMMFKGTDKRGVGSIAQEVEGAGGEINAFTSFDQTVYHLTLASRHVDLGLDIIADVIQRSKIDADELRMEKEVVLEEVRRYRDNPGRQLDQAMFRTLFQSHPYGRPVIGFEETVRGFERPDVHGFYSRWYSPDNMVLVVVGDVDANDVKKQVTKLFKGFDRPSAPARSRPEEPAQTRPRFVAIHQAVQEAHLELAFPICPAEHPDAPLLDLLALILGQGESSRLVEHVKNQQQLVNSIHAYAYTPREPGAFFIGAGFDPKRLMEVYPAILEELHQLKLAPPRTSEIRKAQSIIQSDRVYERETVDGRARKFGYYLLAYGTLEREKAYYRAIEEATPEALWRAARTWFDPDRFTVGLSLPNGMEAPSEEELFNLGRARLTEAQTSPAVIISRQEEETKRIELPNGIRLLVKENHSVPLVAIRAVFEGGLRYERKANNGVFHLISQMMTRGTPHRGAFQIAHEVESLAGGLGGFAGRNSFGLRAELLAQHLERGMELFSEILRGPSFDPHELERVKRVTLEAIRNQQDHPSSYVFRMFSETLYKQHPFRMSMLGTPDSLKAINSSVLKQTYEKYATAGNLVIAVVGDVDPRDMEALVNRHLSNFRPGVPSFPEVPIEPPLTRKRVIRKPNDKQQLHLVIGWRGVSLDHPDRYPIEVMSSILSGQGGRLFLELRDKQGLAYSVSSLSMEALGEGFFAVYIGTEPGKYERAKKGILLEVEKLIQKGVSEEEMRRAKRYLIGSYEIELQRAAALCSNLAFNESYGLGYDSYKEHPARINAVTAEQVLEVARRYLDPNVYVLTGLGPILDG